MHEASFRYEKSFGKEASLGTSYGGTRPALEPRPMRSTLLGCMEYWLRFGATVDNIIQTLSKYLVMKRFLSDYDAVLPFPSKIAIEPCSGGLVFPDKTKTAANPAAGTPRLITAKTPSATVMLRQLVLSSARLARRYIPYLVVIQG